MNSVTLITDPPHNANKQFCICVVCIHSFGRYFCCCCCKLGCFFALEAVPELNFQYSYYIFTLLVTNKKAQQNSDSYTVQYADVLLYQQIYNTSHCNVYFYSIRPTKNKEMRRKNREKKNTKLSKKRCWVSNGWWCFLCVCICSMCPSNLSAVNVYTTH